MMPEIDREERRKKRAPVIAFILIGTFAVAALVQRFQPGWQWVPIAVGTVAVTAVGVSIDPPRGRRRDSRRRGSGPTGRGRNERNDDDGPAGAVPHRWHMLLMVSRLMPRPAGRRWLAEAESLLAEIAPGLRAAAIRSYVLSAAGLVVMMWVREAQRLARPGARRPG